MDYQHLDTRRDGHVLTCTISNPPTQTLTERGVRELHSLLDEAESAGEAAPRVLVLTGGGDGVFITHYEVAELADAAEVEIEAKTAAEDSEPSASAEPEALHPFNRLCLRLERSPLISVAAINGSAAGGGCELSLACDFRLLADGPFVYGLPETSVGIIPGAGGTQRFARMLGTARALDLILHARLLSPTEAIEMGLVHRLVPSERFEREVDAFAADLAGRAPIALAAAKRAIRMGSECNLEDGLAIEERCFARALGSRDAAGAMRAYLAGKSVADYRWSGR